MLDGRYRLGSGGRRASSASFNEAFRVLRSNLDVALLDLDRNSILVTSPNEGEGKTTVATRLATSIVGGGRRVILLDLDLRQPNAHNALNLHNELGATNVLLGEHPLEDCLQFVERAPTVRARTKGFYFLGTGPKVGNPSEVLSLARASQLVGALTDQADIVVIDGPPVLPVADALTIGRYVGGVVLVAEAGRTTYPAIERSIQLLTRNQARLIGIVLNRSEPLESGYGTYGSYGETDAASAS